MHTLGFDFEHGRLDISLHPFCGGVPDDVRITTRYYADDFAHSLMAVIHETGHALYERGLPPDWRHQPVGRGPRHEPAREPVAADGDAGLPLAPVRRLRWRRWRARPSAATAPAWDAENLHRLYTRVKPDFIRVDADEVTYPAHVILRYRLERDLIAGDLELADLPAAWNAGMDELLGIVPPDDREGCLQDIHWYDGAWGYFPTYTLGAMTAAQLFDAAARAPGRRSPEAIGRGDFAPLLAWLRDNVHGHGSRLSTRELLIARDRPPARSGGLQAAPGDAVSELSGRGKR